MKLLSPLIFVALFVLGVFTLANWSALSTSTSLSFLLFTLEAPLGLILLGSTLVFVALFSGYVLVLRTTMLLDARRYSQELKAMHDLAEKSEASRLNELRSQIEREFAQLREAAGQSQTGINARLESTEQTLAKLGEESSRSLSAYIGEVEDKLDRLLAGARTEK